MKCDLVHVVDDDAGVRRSLRLLLRSCGYRVLAWPDAAAFLADAPLHEPACALIDLKMPGMSGTALLAELVDRGAPVAVVMVSGEADVRTAVEALRLGALNFIEKPARPPQLMAAIDEALATLNSRTATATDRIEAAERLTRLSPREREVLRAVADGQQNKMIAIDLGISPRTVEVYRANIMEKLECHSMAALLKLAFRAGLLDTPAPGSGALRPIETMRDSA